MLDVCCLPLRSMYSNLQEYIRALESAGELKRITASVSPILEVAEIANRMSTARAPSIGITGTQTDTLRPDRGGHALLFENLEGVESNIPLAINLFGSYRRMEMALGCDAQGHTPGGLNAIAGRIGALTTPKPPTGLRDAIGMAKQFLPLLRIPPKQVRHAICQQIVNTGKDVNLFELPIIKSWPLDGDPSAVGWTIPQDQPDTSAGQGRFITLAGTYTIHANDRGKAKPPSLNIGMYRSQLLDRTRLAMHWHMHHDGAQHWRSWKRLGQPMPIAIVLGGESVLPYAATCPLPPGISELLMAGFLNRGPIRLVRAKTVPVDVPANAEIVIEGFVSTECGMPDFDATQSETLGPGAVLEGPFGDHTGFYSLPDRYPIVEVTAITRRRDAVYPTTIVGLPPQEDYYLGKATERLFFPLLKTLIHDIQDYDLPLFGCFHNCAILKIGKEYPLQARRVMHAVWGAGQMAWTKILIVVDDDVDVHSLEDVLRALFSYCDFGRDVEVVQGPLDILDHAAPHMGAGHKIGFDATRKMANEDVNTPASEVLPIQDGKLTEREVEHLLSPLHEVENFHLPVEGKGRCLYIAIAKSEGVSARTCIERIMKALPENGPTFILAVDAEVDVRDHDAVLFRLGANADPGRDLIRVEDRPIAVAFDCTTKSPTESKPPATQIRNYPPIVSMDYDTIERVNKKWASDYGFSIQP